MNDPRFPEKNREDKTSEILDIRIEDQTSSQKFDPNSLIIALVSDKLKLGDPIRISVLSGKPGYRYRDSDVGFILTKDELFRFIERDLTPDEYFKLRDKFGMFFMIHDDFYDEETGEAIQPVRARTAVDDEPEANAPKA